MSNFVFFLLTPEAQFIPNKQLQPKETQIYIKLVKYAMQALDIYQVLIEDLSVFFTCAVIIQHEMVLEGQLQVKIPQILQQCNVTCFY